MDQALVHHIEIELRAGRVDAAMASAQKMIAAQGATRDVGIEIAKAVATVYRELIAPPVEAFVARVGKELPEPVGPLVEKAITRLFRITEQWEERLWEVHTERLAREMREWVRVRQVKPAAQNIARLLALAPPEKRTGRARYVGNVLGTVLNNQREAAQVVGLLAKNPGEYFTNAAEVAEIDKARQARASELGNVDLDSLERQWHEALTTVAVEIKNSLPDSSHMGEPDEAVLRDLGDIFRSLLRVPVMREEPELFLDATHIFQEFIPKAQTNTAKLARVEGRTFNTLGFTAQKAVQLTFLEIGKNSFFTTLYREWAMGQIGTDCLGAVVEFMGALRSNDFAGFLKNLKGNRDAQEAVAGQVSTALGSIAGEEATEELITELRGLLHKKRLDAADLKRAEKMVTSLGNVVKSPRTQNSERHKIREFLRAQIPEDLTRLATHTALQVFTYKTDEENPEFRKWAVRALARGLWTPDETTALHKVEDGESALGFRGSIVDALVKIGPVEFNTLVHAIEPLTGRYGAAYMAAADVFERIGNVEALPVLERMLNNALLHNDSESNIYQQEYYWDPASQTRVPLTKHKVLEPIIHAVGTIGGGRANAILKRYQDQIADGRVDPPSANIAMFLDKFKEGGKFVTDGESRDEVMILNDDPATVKTLIKVITAGYWLTGKEKRRMKKVQALTQLAQITPLDAMEPVFQQLADKDLMVVSAAITCLAEFATDKQPKPVRDLAISTALEKLEDRDPAMRQGAVKLLKAIGPNRKEVRPLLLQVIKTSDRRETREALSLMLKTGTGTPSPEDQLAGSVETRTDNMTKLELKQQYMAARQAWIRNGKKGDPPPKPEGVD